MPSEPQLVELHAQLLTLLKKFHEICMKNGIKYSLYGGTLLGAVREKEFIPWDDDLDIVIVRKEYKKLRSVMKQYNQDCFSFEESDQVARFVLTQQGKPTVWIDLFVYDYISERAMPRKIKIYGCSFFSGFVKTKEVFETSKKRNEKRHLGAKFFAYRCANLLGRLFPLRARVWMSNAFREKCFCGKKQYIQISNDQLIGLYIIHPASVMEHYKMIIFEGEEMMITDSYDTILRTGYGDDYMVPKKYGDFQTLTHDAMRGVLNDNIKDEVNSSSDPAGGVILLNKSRQGYMPHTFERRNAA